MVKRKRQKHQTTSNELVASPTSTDKQCVNIDVKKPYKKKLPCWTEYNTENGKPTTTSKLLSEKIISKEDIIAPLNRHAGTSTSDTVHHKSESIVQLQSDTRHPKPGTVVQLQSNKFQSSNREQKREHSLSTLDNQKEELKQKYKKTQDARLIPRIKEDSNAINSMLSNLYRNSPTSSFISDDKKQDRTPVCDVARPKQDDALEVGPMQTTPAATYFDGCPTVKKGNRLTIANGSNISSDQSESREKSLQKISDNLDAKTSDGLCTTKDRSNMLHKFCDDDIGDHIGIEDAGISEGPTQSLLSEHSMEMGNEMANTNTQILPKSNDDKKVSRIRKSTVKRQGDKTEDEAKISKNRKTGSKNQQQADSDTEQSKKEKGPPVQKSAVTFSDVGGNEDNLVEICKLLVHMWHPEVYQKLGVTPLRGILLHGPPGCGKTLLANAIAGELDLPLIKIAATEIVSGVSGDSEENIRDLFEKAAQTAPCILFIDEIDAITPKRETASKDMEKRIVAQLLTCMDDLNANVNCHVLVIGATNRPDALDPGLRRAGRFDREICLGIPDESSRLRILQVLCRNLQLSPGFEFSYLARNTPGYVGADLMALAREAAMIAVNRVFENLQHGKNTPECANNAIVLTDTENIDALSTVTQNNGSSIIVSQAQRNDIPLTSHADNIHVSLAAKTTCVNQIHQSYANSKRISMDDLTTNCNGVIHTMDKVDSGSVTMQMSCVSGNTETTVTNSDIANVNVALVSVGDTMVEQHKAEIFNSAPVAMEHLKHMSQKAAELKSALSWLKEQPPLTEEQLNDFFITIDDFKEALKCVQPSAKREGFATIPNVTWDDIGALKDIREKLELTILAPVRYPELFKGLGLTRAQGVMLAGPPGCGKTLLAKAVANETGINFISVKGPELLNMYVGESERAVRTVFQRARNSAPCVIFFDEVDALCPRRSGSSEGNSSARVVNQLLTEMDGLEERKQVFIMAATNRPDIIDPAVLRPGRLDKTLFVGFPTVSDRLDILKCITKNGTHPQLSPDVDLARIAEDQRCDCFTGADLSLLVREASENALKEAICLSRTQPTDTIMVNQANFEAALKSIKPSVSIKDKERYCNMKNNLAVE